MIFSSALRLKTMEPSFPLLSSEVMYSPKGTSLNLTKYMIITPIIGNRRPITNPRIGTLRFINSLLAAKIHGKTSIYTYLIECLTFVPSRKSYIHEFFTQQSSRTHTKASCSWPYHGYG